MASSATRAELIGCLSLIETLEKEGFEDDERLKGAESSLQVLSQALEREAGAAVGGQEGDDVLSTRTVALQLASKLDRIAKLAQEVFVGGALDGRGAKLRAVSIKVFEQLDRLYRVAPDDLVEQPRVDRFWDETSTKEFFEIKGLKLADGVVKGALERARRTDSEGPIPVVLCRGSDTSYIKVCFCDQAGNFKKKPLKLSDITDMGFDEIAGIIRTVVTGVMNPPCGVVGVSAMDGGGVPPLIAALHTGLGERLSCFDTRDFTDLTKSVTQEREFLRARDDRIKEQLQEAQKADPSSQAVVLAPGSNPYVINIYFLDKAGERQKGVLCQLDKQLSFEQALIRIRTKASVEPGVSLRLMAHPEEPVLSSVRMLKDAEESTVHKVPKSLLRSRYPLNGTSFHQQCASLCYRREFDGEKHGVDLENKLLERYAPTKELVRVQAWLLPNQMVRLVWSSPQEQGAGKKQVLELPVGIVERSQWEQGNDLGESIRSVIDPEGTGVMISLLAEQAGSSAVHQRLQAALEQAWLNGQKFSAQHPDGPEWGDYWCQVWLEGESINMIFSCSGSALGSEVRFVGSFQEGECAFDIERGAWSVLVPRSLNYIAMFGQGLMPVGPPVEHEVRTRADLERVLLALYDAKEPVRIKGELEKNRERLLAGVPEVQPGDLEFGSMQATFGRCLELAEGQRPVKGQYILVRNGRNEAYSVLYNDSGNVRSARFDINKLAYFLSQEALDKGLQKYIGYRGLIAPTFELPQRVYSEKLGDYSIRSGYKNTVVHIYYQMGGKSGRTPEFIELSLSDFSDEEIASRKAMLAAIEEHLMEILPRARLRAITSVLEAHEQGRKPPTSEVGAYRMTSSFTDPSRIFFTIRGPEGRIIESSIPEERIPLEVCKDLATFKQWVQESVIVPALEEGRDLQRDRLRHRLQRSGVTVLIAETILQGQPSGTYVIGWEPAGKCVLSCVAGDDSVQTAVFPLDEEWLGEPAQFDEKVRKRIAESFKGVDPKPLKGQEELEELLVACKKVGCSTQVSARKALLNHQPGTYIIHFDESSRLPMLTWMGPDHTFQHAPIPRELLLADASELAAWLIQKIGPQAFRLVESVRAADEDSGAGKTVASREKLARGVFPDVPPSGPFPYQGRRYHLVSRNSMSMSTVPYVSLGSNPVGREALLIDPENCPGLDLKFREWVERLQARLEPGAAPKELEVLGDLSKYIRESVFPRVSTEAVDDFVENWKQNDRGGKKTSSGVVHPVIPIDAFVAEGVGVCRHISMVTAYFLDRLSREHGGTLVPKGTVHHVRSNITSGGHAWNLFVTKEGDAWHIDNTWRSLPPTKVAAGGKLDKGRLEELGKRGYGHFAMGLQEALLGL